MTERFFGNIFVDNNLAPSIEQTNKNEQAVIEQIEQLLVIPEKASSFKVHPERICKDQCFYCGGKFGLYDTPCHIAQIKSSDRQNKILQSKYIKYCHLKGSELTEIILNRRRKANT